MIATLDQLKLYLGKTTTDEDALLNLILNGANQIVETYIGRTVSVAGYTEIIDGNGQMFYVLPNYPINTITSISVNTGTLASPIREVISAENYSFVSKTGVVSFFCPLQRGFKNYKFIYNAGFTTVPADLIMAVLKLASKYYNTKSSDGIASESTGGDSISFDVSQIPNDILVILSNYRDM